MAEVNRWEEVKQYKCPNCGYTKSMTTSEASEHETVECPHCYLEFPVRAK